MLTSSHIHIKEATTSNTSNSENELKTSRTDLLLTKNMWITLRSVKKIIALKDILD